MENLFHFIEVYFIEKRIESFIFIIIGTIAFLLALFFLLIIKYSFFKGMAIPLIVIGFIQLTIGINSYSQYSQEIIKVNYLIKKEPKEIQTEELSRIEKKIENYIIYQWIEISLILIGIILFVKFYNSSQAYWKGLGLGLLIQVSIMLSLNIIAEHRSVLYYQKLLEINQFLN